MNREEFQPGESLMRRIQVLVWFMALLPSIGLAQDAETTDDKSSAKKDVSPLRKVMDESLAWDELFVNEQSAAPMTAKVVLRWANNARGSENGMTVLFLADGRPEAVCCVYPWEQTLARIRFPVARHLARETGRSGRLES